MTTRVALLSPCGGGNLGDAAIIESLIHGIGRRVRDAAIVGFTGNPNDTTARHGIEAFRLVAGAWHRGTAANGAGGSPERGGHMPRARRVLGALPGARQCWRIARRVVADHRFYRNAAERIRTFAFVVVAGGGQFDDFYGGPFTYPYALWRWGGVARRIGARYVILSVGTGRLQWPSPLFVRRALALADYASFRDDRSRELVGDGSLTAAMPTVPDLAYALPLPGDHPLPSPASAPPVVGVSPMSYGDPRSWPEEGATRYRRHVDSLVGLTVKLVRSGHEVVLFVTDGPDRVTLEEVRDQASSQLAPVEQARLRVPSVGGLDELMRALAQVDIVVAARLHGVLLAHILGRPALAISHERKVATLMGEMGLARYCQEIDDFDLALGWERFAELSRDRHRISAELRAAVAERRRRVDAQYDEVFGSA